MHEIKPSLYKRVYYSVQEKVRGWPTRWMKSNLVWLNHLAGIITEAKQTRMKQSKLFKPIWSDYTDGETVQSPERATFWGHGYWKRGCLPSLIQFTHWVRPSHKPMRCRGIKENSSPVISIACPECWRGISGEQWSAPMICSCAYSLSDVTLVARITSCTGLEAFVADLQ